MKHSYFKGALLVTASVALTNCATILRKDDSQVIRFNPEQEKTMVFVNGKYLGETPVEMKVDRSQNYEVTYVKKNYISESFTLENGVIGKWLFLDLVCLPVTAVVPTIVDAITGEWKGIQTKNIPKRLKNWSEIKDPTTHLNNLFQIENLHFETGKDVINTDSYEDLDRLAEILNSNSDVKITIHGHTDKTGSDDINVKLSKDRAVSVKEFLMDRGVDESRIDTIGHGSSQPLVEESTESDKALNRRVEFEYHL